MKTVTITLEFERDFITDEDVLAYIIQLMNYQALDYEIE